jgi:hypothetical protein
MTHLTAMPAMLKFDFRMKFYTSLMVNYKEGLWGNAAWTMVSNVGDFSQWGGSGIGFITDPQFALYDCTSQFVALNINHISQGALATWSVTLTGHGFDPNVYRRERLFACTMAFDYPDTLGQLTTTEEGLGFVGSIRSVAPAESPKINGEFTMVVEGIGSYLNSYFMPVMSWGKYNIAKGKNCSWSSTLGEPSQLYNSGEFVGTQVTLGPENAVDGAIFGPPAVSAVPPAGTDLIRTISGRAFVREVYMWPPTGYGSEYQWISVSANTRFMMSKGQGGYKAHVGDDAAKTTWWSFDTPYPLSPGGNQYGVGVFCYSRRRVEELFDLSDTEWVVEWGEKNDVKLSPTEDYLSIGDGVTHAPHTDGVYWSTNSAYKPVVPRDDNHTDGSHGPYFEWGSGHPWYIPAAINPNNIPAGSGIARRIWHSEGSYWELEKDTDTPGDWLITDLPSPVCWVDTDAWEHTGKGPLDEAQYQWGIVNIGEMSCLLDVNFNPTVTLPATMYMQSMLGLSESGTAIVNNQKFTYTAKTADGLTVATWLGNTSIVGAGNAVYQYDTVINETRRGYRVRRIVLWRKPKMSHILRGSIHGSIYAGTQRVPTDTDEWWRDWIGIGDQALGLQIRPGVDAVDTGKYVVDLGYDPERPEKNRYLQLMVKCEAMRGNEHLYPVGSPLRIESGGLFMLNEIEVFLDEVSKDDHGNTAEPVVDWAGNPIGSSNSIASIIIDILQTQLGFPASRVEFVPEIDTVAVSSQTTTRSTYANVISELLLSYGIIMVESMQGTLRLARNPWFRILPSNNAPKASVSAFGSSELANVTTNYGALNSVAQARVVCRDPEGYSTFIGVYPKSPDGLGEHIDGGSGTMIASDQEQANAIAEAMYKQASNKNSMSATVTGVCTWLKPFTVIELSWLTNDPDSFNRSESLWIVRSVSHIINLGTVPTGAKPSEKNWITTFECQSFQRQTVPFLDLIQPTI